MIQNITPQAMVKWLGLASGAMLGMAYFFEYGMGLAPCTMCYWQRIPHGIVLGIGVVALLSFVVNAPIITKLMLSVMMLSLMAGACIAAWHSGVELKILPGPTACSGGVALDGSPAALVDQLLAAPVVRCDEVPWSLFGLSMANWNMLITAAMAILAGAALRQTFKSR